MNDITGTTSLDGSIDRAYTLRRTLRIQELNDIHFSYEEKDNGWEEVNEDLIKDKVNEFHQWQAELVDLQPVYLNIEQESINEPIAVEFGRLYYVQTEGLKFKLPGNWTTGKAFGIQLAPWIQKVTTDGDPEEITGFIDGIPAHDAVHFFYYDGQNVIYEIGDY
jgi:hypothetical protein